MVVLNDWKLGRIGDEILALEAGVSVNSDANKNGTNYYILKTSAVSSGQVNLNEVKPVVPRDVTRLKCSLTANSILISRMNTPELVGECGYVENDNEKIFLPDRIWQTVLKQGSQLNCKWLNYVLNTSQLRQYIKNAATGTSNSMKNISKDQILNIEIYFPVPDEQNAIAEALSDADNLIASLEKLIAKKKAIKQGAMQELLTGKKRLPGFSGEWEHAPLENLLAYEQPQKYIIKSNKYSNSGIAVLTPGKTFILGYTHEDDGIYPQPTILFDDFLTISRYVDFPFKVKSSAVKMLTPKRKQDNIKIIYEIMQLIDFSVVDHQRHWISQYSKLCVRIPTAHEQDAIVSILSDMDAEMEQLEKKLAKYHLVKQGMMQELLTGRIRLIETDKKAETAPNGHNQQYDDALAISAIVNAFYDDRFILGRVKVQKLLYLLRRKQDADVSAFKKKAAGPYNEKARYKGGESIAIKSGYITVERNDKGSKFSKGKKIDTALKYVGNMQPEIDWLFEKFRFYNTNKGTKNLEVLATVDMAVCELEKDGKVVNLDTVKEVIRSNKEWAPKLQKPYFTDTAISQAIVESKELFD